MTEKPSVTLPGTVEKIIQPSFPDQVEKAQISIEGGDDLYREIRIQNSLSVANGEEVRLKKGAEVDGTEQADQEATTSKDKEKH